MKRKRGRPTKLTPENEKIIVEGIQQGLSYKAAAQRADVSYQTMYNWMNKGEEDEESGIDSDFLDFFYAIKNAEIDFQLAHLRRIDRASMEGSWQASAWALERRFPDEWGKKERIEQTTQISGPNNGPVRYEYGVNDDDMREIEQSVERIIKRYISTNTPCTSSSESAERRMDSGKADSETT